ncbi:hypothetical protein AAG570_001634 [Ranatra chinensis]|uniref:C3H1-type domain-containing protein n=1 Tax=Ranatra chinensis TaxID=642074 RepID=A0ABD0Y9X8_9HEMI
MLLNCFIVFIKIEFVCSQGRCNRDKPPCKYFHPPQHLKDQLLINGRNHLALKNALMQQMGLTPGGQHIVPGQVPTVCVLQAATGPYLAAAAGVPQVGAGAGGAGAGFSPYFSPAAAAAAGPLSMVQQTVVTQQKMPRTDRLEVCREWQRGSCARVECRFAHPSEPAVVPAPDNTVTVCMDALRGRCARQPCRYFHPPLHLQAIIKATTHSMDMKSVGSFYYENFAFPGVVPYKRTAGDKSGVPVYQPSAAAAAAAAATAAYAGLALNKVGPGTVAAALGAAALGAAAAAKGGGGSGGAAPAPAPLYPPPPAPQYSPYAMAAMALAAGVRPPPAHHPSLASAPSAPPPAPAPPATLISDLLTAQYPSTVNNNNEEELQPYKKMKTT